MCHKVIACRQRKRERKSIFVLVLDKIHCLLSKFTTDLIFEIKKLGDFSNVLVCLYKLGDFSEAPSLIKNSDKFPLNGKQ